jgi:hypothetical protein
MVYNLKVYPDNNLGMIYDLVTLRPIFIEEDRITPIITNFSAPRVLLLRIFIRLLHHFENCR